MRSHGVRVLLLKEGGGHNYNRTIIAYLTYTYLANKMEVFSQLIEVRRGIVVLVNLGFGTGGQGSIPTHDGSLGK